MQAAVLNKLREYRWELWLFFGVPAFEWTARTISFAVAEPIDTSTSSWLAISAVMGLPAGLMRVVLLDASHRCLRFSGRPFLRWVYLFALAMSGLSVLAIVWESLIYYCLDLSGGRNCLAGANYASIFGFLFFVPLLRFATLVWFARKASRWGFDNAVALIAISLALTSSLNTIPPIGVPDLSLGVGFYIIFCIVTAGFSLVGVWILHRFDSGDGLATIRWLGLLPALIVGVFVLNPESSHHANVIALGDSAWPWARSLPVAIELFSFTPVALLIATSVWHGIAIVVVWVFKLKNVNDESSLKAPPNILYGGRWRDP